MNSALDDILIVLQFLCASKTLTGEQVKAMERLIARSQQRIPVDMRLDPTQEAERMMNRRQKTKDG